MNIYVRNIPEPATNKQVENYFNGPLKNCNVHNFHVEKHRGRPTATITVLDSIAAQNFLDKYGIPQRQGARPLWKLHWGGSYIICSRGRNEPSNFLLRSLADEASQLHKKIITSQGPSTTNKEKGLTRFNIDRLHCGVWDYTNKAGKTNSHLIFTSHFTESCSGHINFGRKEAIVLLKNPMTDQCRIDIRYEDCHDINLGTYEEPAITFNLKRPPRMYEIKIDEVLAATLACLRLDRKMAQLEAPKKIRLPAINSTHAKLAGTCMVYRIVLSDSSLLPLIRNLLTVNAPGLATSYKTLFQFTKEKSDATFVKLGYELSDQHRMGNRPFKLLYQIDRLARNGFLPPETVLKLLPAIGDIHTSFGLDATIAAIRKFSRDVSISPPGPNMEASEYSFGTLEKMLREYAAAYNPQGPENPYELAKRYSHVILVHKLVVTPAGVYLNGPEAEPANRVLRRYATTTDNFIRVVFEDEGGGPLRYDARTNQDRIYHERFQGVLDTSIIICGKSFSFLGFSHSSLRSQSCWFMSPIVKNGRLFFAENVIKELGDFSKIRIPAKCAARIGQNFTDTNATVQLLKQQLGELPMVLRNERDFSDGVGTISLDLLRRVWRVYGTRRFLKPSVLQVRFQGAKGIVSLDSRLHGEQLLLRKNMKKYETDATWDLEICGAAFRPLPMVLNRPFIKIFEDLGVPMSVFMDLQNATVNKLQRMTDSAVNTAFILEETEGTNATGLPGFIRHLGQIGFNYHQDIFLYRVVEMAVVSKLRDIKYRGRIPVGDGVTLYGIMDETGYLRENEIYVVTEKTPEGGKFVLEQDRVVITRSPALHPGDIQIVRAVDVPATSPLKYLSNVVVFSQHGERDLASMLSGGDLDGDLYNVIWDRRFIPERACPAAEYPRTEALELNRVVPRKDMSDFFITFMKSDQLGNICTMHLQLADQSSNGTFDENCLRLANMASTAVDFSKTGVPVDMKNCPRVDRCRPDFMAPSPRVIISENGYVDLEEDDVVDDDAFEGLDAERRPFRYYESQKALGHLYRAVDERKFIDKMQKEHRQLAEGPTGDIPIKLLEYMEFWATQYGVEYVHHKQIARDIRERCCRNYEESLVNILYETEPSPHSTLSEIEVYSGQVLGRQGGPQGKPLRELGKAMRERFDVIVNYVTMRITKGDTAIKGLDDLDELYDERYDERELEGLPRAIACLHVAVHQTGYRDRRVGELKSFRYLAAAICLKELERYRITTFGSVSGLPRAWL